MKSDAQILKVLAGSDTENCKTSTSQFGTVPVWSALSYQQKIVESDSDIVINNPDEVIFPGYQLPELTSTYYTVLNYSGYNTFMGLHIHHNLSLDIEQQITAQSFNKTWHDVRRNRITSSVFKDICCRKSDFESLASRLLQTNHTNCCYEVWS